MKAGQIVIVTEKTDAHADRVILRLRELGHQPVRLHTADIPLHSSFNFTLDNAQSQGWLKTRTTSIALDDIRSIWWRRPRANIFPASLSDEHRKFAKHELEHALTGVWASLDCYWMSFPARIHAARLKPEQLRRAARLGFEIPRTLFTLDPEAVMEFYDRCNGRIIFKVMSDPSMGAFCADPDDPSQPRTAASPSVKCTYTTLLTAEALQRHVGKVRSAPCQFQEYVEKKHELRVTIIGDRIFAAEIDSQAQERTRFDWRHYDVPMRLRAGQLPSDVAERCFAFVRSYGLNFGAIDLIHTPDGRYVFLENNPNGQWLFVEDGVPEFKMTHALADCLARGEN